MLSRLGKQVGPAGLAVAIVALVVAHYEGNKGAERTGAYILFSGVGGFSTGSFATTGAP
jgi:hypothetical protein